MATTIRDEVRKIWTEAFPEDSLEWVENYFSRIFRDDDVIIGRSGGQAVSSLMLQPYRMRLGSVDVGMGYISGAATRKSKRGRGYMSALMTEALATARERGDSVVTLIPAHDWLFPFYERFGFATVFYVRADRFTSAHRFATEIEYEPYDNIYEPSVYEAFSRLEHAQPGWRVVHSQRDFLNILDDLRLDEDSAVGIAIHPADGHIAGMSFGSLRDGCVVVTDALGETDDARTGALRMLRMRWPDTPFKVLTPAPQESAGGGPRGIFPRAMLRIVNAESMLRALAREYRGWKCTIRVTDPILAENNATFRCEGGECHQTPSGQKVDYSLDVTLLGKMLFSSKPMGDLLGIISGRPHMSLMLDF